MFYENKLQKANQNEFTVEKAMETKGDKLYVEEKDYDNSFNSWINKKKHNKNQIYLIMTCDTFSLATKSSLACLKAEVD